MSKHTPGPWEARSGLQHGFMQHDVHAIGEDDRPVARMWLKDDDTEAEANARLIAAAPEMLDLLRVCLLHLKVRSPLYAEVRTAIAKAEGR